MSTPLLFIRLAKFSQKKPYRKLRVTLGCSSLLCYYPVMLLTYSAFTLLCFNKGASLNDAKEPWDISPALPGGEADYETKNVREVKPLHSEDIKRIEVDEEDRLAFRVGVNFITLVLIGVGVYFLIRYLWG
jgi:hypothetical protein